MRKNLAIIGLMLLNIGCNENKPASYEIQQITQLSFPGGNWIDLSYDFDSNTIVWPTSDPFQLDTVSEGMNDQGYYYSAYKFSMAEHGGTHIDAPIHFSKKGKSVDQLPLSQLMGKLYIIDVITQSEDNRDYLIGTEVIEQFESSNGNLPDGCILFFRTGYGKYWPDALKYLGTKDKGPQGVATLHFPGLSPEASQWLVDNRKIRAVGIDTPSIDYGQSKDFKTHRILAGKNIPILENVANLDSLPETGAWVIALPLKIKGGSGGPVRISALIP